MKMKILGLAIAIGTLSLGAPGCSQPPPQCTAGPASFSPFVARFVHMSGDDGCAGPGDLIGLFVYNPNANGVPDPSRRILAIQTSLVGGLQYPDFEDGATLDTYSIGDLTSVEPVNDFCTASQLSVATVTWPEVACFPEGSTECFADEHCCAPMLCDPDEVGAGCVMPPPPGPPDPDICALPVCGDMACDVGEECFRACDPAADPDCYECDADCGPCGVCGNNQCEAGEDCTSCPGDCGACPTCGDMNCDAGESCDTCDSDCGPCDPAQPEVTGETAEWNNFQIYVTTASLGTQATGDLTYTSSLAACQETVKAVMLWPAVGCEKVQFFMDADPDDEDDPCDTVALCDPLEDGRPNCVPCDPAVDDPNLCLPFGIGEPEEKLCDAEPDPEPEYALPFGSGIPPEANVRCDPTLLLCVLAGDTIPSVK